MTMADAQAAMRPLIRMNPVGIGNIIRDDTFWYTTPVPFLFGAAGTENLNQVIPIQSDAHFLCTQTMYTNTAEIGISGAGVGVPYLNVLNGGATIQITDGGSQRFLSSAFVPLSSIFGNGKLPYIWPLTHLFKANTSIGISITGSGAPMITQTVRVVFGGFKIPKGVIPGLD